MSIPLGGEASPGQSRNDMTKSGGIPVMWLYNLGVPKAFGYSAGLGDEKKLIKRTDYHFPVGLN